MAVSVPISAGQMTGSIFKAGIQGGGPLFIAENADWMVPDSWVTVEVIAKGKNVTVLVNGTKTADKAIEEMGSEGQVTLGQSKPGGVFTVRKIEIKELPPTPAATPPRAIAPSTPPKPRSTRTPGPSISASSRRSPTPSA